MPPATSQPVTREVRRFRTVLSLWLTELGASLAGEAPPEGTPFSPGRAV